MKLSKKTIDGTITILASNDYQAIPFMVSGTSPVKAGMPMKLDGTPVAAGTDADGILLYDVDPNNNPNAALLVDGIVDWEKCQDHSGATATAATMKAALPNIIFRENTGVTKTTTSDSGGSGGGSNSGETT